MTTRPTSAAITSSSVTNAQQKTNLGDLTQFVGDLLGDDSTDKVAARAALGVPSSVDPVFTGNPTAPTPAPGDDSDSVATTEFVQEAIDTARQNIGTLLPSRPTTSGTFNDFTSIPSWAKKITINISGFSANGSSSPIVQLGDSGGVEATGYGGVVIQHLTGSAPTLSGFTTGFIFEIGMVPSTVLSGNIVLTLADATTNKWNTVGNFWRVGSSAVQISLVGEKSLSATLDRIRITTGNGTDLLDAGSWSVAYE